MRRLQQLPLAGDIPLREMRNDPVGNLLKVLRSESQDRRARAGETDAQQTRLRGRGHTLQDLRQTWDESLAVRLMDLVLHGEENGVRIWRRGPQSERQESCALQVEDDVLAGVGRRQHGARVGGRHDKVRDDGDGLDLPSPPELAVVADVVRRLRRLLARVDPAGGLRKDLAERDLDTRNVLRLELVEVGADKAAKKGCGDVVRVSFYDRQ